LTAGQIAGFAEYKIDRQSFRPTVQQNDLPVGDKLVEAFGAFAAGDKTLGLTEQNVASQAEYARTRIREELVTANYSNEAGVQVLLENDPQILKALEAMGDARKMNESVAWNRQVSLSN